MGEYAKWDRKSSAAEIEHQLDGHEGSSRSCEKWRYTGRTAEKGLLPRRASQLPAK